MLKKPAIFRIPEFKVFAQLKKPAEIQDFIDRMPMNFRNVCRSPLLSLKKNKIYCLDGAILAAAILWYHGKNPLFSA